VKAKQEDVTYNTTEEQEPKILVRSRRRLTAIAESKNDAYETPISEQVAQTNNQASEAVEAISEAIVTSAETIISDSEEAKPNYGAEIHAPSSASHQAEDLSDSSDNENDADISPEMGEQFDTDIFEEDSYQEEAADFDEENFSIDFASGSNEGFNSEFDIDPADLQDITEQEFLTSDKDLLFQDKFEGDFGEDFLDCLDDDVETVDELSDNNKLSRRQRARQVALGVIINADWEPNLECIEAVTDIFEEYGWSKTKTSIENAIANGCSLEHIRTARDLRHFWRDNEKFWTTFKGISPFELHARAAYKNLSWPQALSLVEYNEQLMSVEEVERYLDEEFDYWYGNTTLLRCFPAFLPYLYARRRMSAFSDMADVGELGIGSLASHDPLDSLNSLYGIPPIAKRLEDIGVSVSNLATFKPTYETFVIRYPQK
jgi:hypothetical protein